MAAAGGPRKRICVGVAASAVGSSGFSEAWPLHTNMDVTAQLDTGLHEQQKHSAEASLTDTGRLCPQESMQCKL
jgi:hypothetical protein